MNRKQIIALRSGSMKQTLDIIITKTGAASSNIARRSFGDGMESERALYPFSFRLIIII